MKKIISVFVWMIVFCLGFGMGQYYYEKRLTIPGLAMATAKPNIVNMRTSDFGPAAPHRWGILLVTDTPVDVVEMKTPTNVGIYFK